jgi:hypothetical protein
MGKLSHEYVPEICARLFRDGIKSGVRYELAKRWLGVLTLKEAEESFDYCRERIERFFKNMGWDPGLVKKLINLN